MTSISDHDPTLPVRRRAEDGQIAVPWTALVNVLLAGFIALGGYVWTTTVTRVQALETTVTSRGERIAVLEVRSIQQDEAIRILRAELLRMNDKLDALLRRP